MTEVAGLLLLLPIAVAAGWWWGRRASMQRSGGRSAISSEYFRGLNYLLNEEPDKAIEVFLELADVNPDTVETHLALGSLFRRRGEVEKAIGFHRHIISRNRLTAEQRSQALLELAEDFFSAGLLDRAEKLFLELAGVEPHAETARCKLLLLYQQEKEWQSALDQATWLSHNTDAAFEVERAQFQCELAQERMVGGDHDAARRWLGGARRANPDCVRVDLIEGDLLRKEGRIDAAAAAYRAALGSDPDLSLLLADRLIETHLDDELGLLISRLESLMKSSGTLAPLLLWARIIGEHSPGEALDRLSRTLETRPSLPGLELLLTLEDKISGGRSSGDRLLLAPLVAALTRCEARYRCGHCGYESQLWHWRCPSCRRWETVRPATGVVGV